MTFLPPTMLKDVILTTLNLTHALKLTHTLTLTLRSPTAIFFLTAKFAKKRKGIYNLLFSIVYCPLSILFLHLFISRRETLTLTLTLTPRSPIAIFFLTAKFAKKRKRIYNSQFPILNSQLLIIHAVLFPHPDTSGILTL